MQITEKYIMTSYDTITKQNQLNITKMSLIV